jgi:hypothetical protein
MPSDSTISTFPSEPTGTWHISHRSTCIQVTSTWPTTLAHRDFTISGFGSLCINTSHFSRQPNSRNYPLLFCLIQRSKYFSQIYSVDILETLEFQVLGVCASAHPSFPDSQTLERLLGYPRCTFSRYDGHKRLSFFQTDPTAPTPQVLSSLSLCG